MSAPVDGWLLIEAAIVVALAIAAAVATRPDARFGRASARASIALSGLLVLVCAAQWLLEGATVLTLTLGVLSVAIFAYALMRSSR